MQMFSAVLLAYHFSENIYTKARRNPRLGKMTWETSWVLDLHYCRSVLNSVISSTRNYNTTRNCDSTFSWLLAPGIDVQGWPT